MSGTETSLASAVTAVRSPAAEVTESVGTARVATLDAVRVGLLSPINTVIELSELLLHEGHEQERDELASDLRKIHEAARSVRERLHRLIERGSEELGDAPDPTSRLRHDLRGMVGSIIGYSDLWLEEAEAQFLEGFVEDLTRIRDLGRQMLAVIDQVLRVDVEAPAPAVATPQPVRIPIPLNRATVAPGTILVVDDTEVSRELIVRRLRLLGHEVIEATDGFEALEYTAERPFDLVLLDILMPGMDGFEVLRRLKIDPATAALPVLMITGLDDIEAVAHAIELGAEDYLSHPVNPVLLSARIGACLEKKRLHDREREYLRTIERERSRTDQLLRSILPEPVVDELQATNAVKPVRRDHVAVLFADLVGFTRFCDDQAPEKVVAIMERLVDGWDDVAARRGLEKIKNLGDGMLGVRGLLVPAADPVWDCIECGRELITVAQQLGPGWNARIGVNVGPVVAGLLGRRQSLFDLWGDTVNTASRVESHGLPGRVNLSAEAFAAVSDRFPSVEPRLVDVRGKGQIELFAV